ncbi:MAG: DUF6159 family protein, partial [Pseudomonadota bacterium]
AWAVASYFVVPLLVVEELEPIEAVKRSASLVRKSWGESIGAEVGSFFFILEAMIPGILALVLGLFVFGVSKTIGAIVLTGATLWIVWATLLGSALDAMVRTALYIYAVEGKVADGFSSHLVSRAFARPSPRRPLLSAFGDRWFR